jgi:hypothetical protein
MFSNISCPVIIFDSEFDAITIFFIENGAGVGKPETKMVAGYTVT